MRFQTMTRGAVFVSILGVAAVLYACGKPAHMDEVSGANGRRPIGAVQGEKNFAKLINSYAEAKSTPTPWAGFWWPFTAHGIASGTHGGGQSPAGKYDAARGGRTHAQDWEMKNHGPTINGRKVQGWEGHCNGWCVASVLFPEPVNDVVVNGITFTVADIKGILTEMGMESSADMFGERVEHYQDYDSPKYNSVIPDQFFLILTNYMGRAKQPVLLDRFTGSQVWNQPVAGYRFEYPKPEDYLGPAPGAPNIHRLNMTATVWWARDEVTPGTITGPFNFTTDNYFDERTLKMEIWLDAPVTFGADGKIASSGDVIVAREGDYLVGGQWNNGAGMLDHTHPDYMWIPYSVLKGTTEANPELDLEWVKKWILGGGGQEPGVTPSSIPTAPNPSRRPIPDENDPQDPFPEPTRTGGPISNPWPIPQPTGPRPQPTTPAPMPPAPQPPGPAPMPAPMPVPPAPGPAPMPAPDPFPDF